MRRLGIIGAGGMAQTVLSTLAAHLPAPLDHIGLLVPEGSAGRAEELLAGCNGSMTVHTQLSDLLADKPDLVVECAGHGALRQHGPGVLASGCDLVVISVGALADDALRITLDAAAREGGAGMVLAPGAVGGIDVLVASKLSGLHEVVYTGRKPPRAWRGTPAAALLDLDALSEPALFFEGTARDAARDYPQNANVAATIALAGAGFDATRVRLIADPGAAGNVHELSVRSACADFTIRLEGRASPANPKTSLTAGFSVAREILNRALALAI